MEPNLEKRLQAIEERVEDIYTIVRRMRNAQQRAAFFKLLYWAVIIILGFVAVEAIKPYLEQLNEMYTGVTQTTKGYGDILKSLGQ